MESRDDHRPRSLEDEPGVFPPGEGSRDPVHGAGVPPLHPFPESIRAARTPGLREAHRVEPGIEHRPSDRVLERWTCIP